MEAFCRVSIPLFFSLVISRSFSSSCLDVIWFVIWFVAVAFSAFLWHGLCGLFGGGSLRVSYLLFAVREQIRLSFYEKLFFGLAGFVGIAGE